MRVNKQARKDATLLMLHHQKLKYQVGEQDTLEVTAYTVANWHSIPQSNAWELLKELVHSRFVKRYTSNGEKPIILYALTKRGQNYVDRHVLECIAAHTRVVQWKISKYKRGFST